MSFENETWIIDVGDEVIQKKAAHGVSSLSTKEKLIYCLWVVDYSIRNAGDFETARDMYPNFQAEGARFASELSLPLASETFSLPLQVLGAQYEQRFDRLCDEIKAC